VNTNQYDVKKLKEVMDKEKLNWRSYADTGKITKQFNLVGTPTLYIIDHKGVIRHKWLGGPGEKVIDAAIEKLLKEAQADAK
jgi:peroxiredoxin